MKIKSIVIVISLLLFSGCAYKTYKEGLFPDKRKAFLYFPENIKNVLISIDGGELFEIKPGKNNQYQVKPGKHEIKIYKNNELIMKKNMNLKDGDIMEIEL